MAGRVIDHDETGHEIHVSSHPTARAMADCVTETSFRFGSQVIARFSKSGAGSCTARGPIGEPSVASSRYPPFGPHEKRSSL